MPSQRSAQNHAKRAAAHATAAATLAATISNYNGARIPISTAQAGAAKATTSSSATYSSPTNNAGLMRIKIVTEETFRGHQGYDLFDPQKVTFEEEVIVNKADRLLDVLYRLSGKFKCLRHQLRIWPITMGRQVN